MEENDQAQAVSRLCRKGCGFYGSPTFDGFCSKCHRDMQATAENARQLSRIPTFAESSSNEDDDSCVESKTATYIPPAEATNEERLPKCDDSKDAEKSKSPGPPEDSAKESAQKSDPKKHLRCSMCNKRVGLTGFSCRCGRLFCTVHRYSDSHDCVFDYRESGQEDIRKANPQVICSKINKI